MYMYKGNDICMYMYMYGTDPRSQTCDCRYCRCRHTSLRSASTSLWHGSRRYGTSLHKQKSQQRTALLETVFISKQTLNIMVNTSYQLLNDEISCTMTYPITGKRCPKGVFSTIQMCLYSTHGKNHHQNRETRLARRTTQTPQPSPYENINEAICVRV